MQGSRPSWSHSNWSWTDFWISISICSLPLSTDEMANIVLSNTAIVTGLLLGFVLLSLNNTIPPAGAGEKAFDGSKRRATHQIQSISLKLPALGQLKYCQSLHGTSGSIKGRIGSHATGANIKPTWVLVCQSLASGRVCHRVGMKGKSWHYLGWRENRSPSGPVLLAMYLRASMLAVSCPKLYPDSDAICSNSLCPYLKKKIKIVKQRKSIQLSLSLCFHRTLQQMN